MRIAIIGAAGQLGTDLRQLCGPEAIGLGHSDIEITDPTSVKAALDSAAPDCVINAAAYNKVDQAEDEPQVAFANNALGPRNLAMECQSRGIVLVHVSTDYVFGNQTDRDSPYTETDEPGPVSAYGISKLAGEHLVRSSCTKHFVVRTCGLYGHAARSGAGKGNFVETMLRLGREKDQLTIVNDQVCTPTSSLELARMICELIKTDDFGLYHAVNQGHASWFDFASEIFQHAGIEVEVKPIPSSDYPTPARRPAYSVLSNEKLQTAIGREIPTWQASLSEYLTDRERLISAGESSTGQSS